MHPFDGCNGALRMKVASSALNQYAHLFSSLNRLTTASCLLTVSWILSLHVDSEDLRMDFCIDSSRLEVHQSITLHSRFISQHLGSS